jgi:hypothetical protein
LGSNLPDIWEIKIDQKSAPALYEVGLEQKKITLKCLQTDPRNRQSRLSCLPLLLIRGNEKILLPDENQYLDKGNQILWCGKQGSASWMEWILRDPSILTYLLTGNIISHGYFWKWMQNKKIKTKY